MIDNKAVMQQALDALPDMVELSNPMDERAVYGYTAEQMQAYARAAIAQSVEPANDLERYITANYPDAAGNTLADRVISALEAMDIELGMKEIAQPIEPALYQFQAKDGAWCYFTDERHYKNTVADGRWPIRALYEHPTTAQPATHKLLQIIAAAYQIAGACDMPVYILDVLANPERATQEQIDAMLPFVRPASEQNFCPRCGKRLGGTDDIHTCTPVVQS